VISARARPGSVWLLHCVHPAWGASTLLELSPPTLITAKAALRRQDGGGWRASGDAFRASITSVNANTRRVAVGHAAAAPPLLLRRWAASVSKLVELVQIGRFEPVHDYDEP
jgi:hypothetical protein